MRRNCSLIGAALDIGQPNEGTDLAPSWLRVNGLIELVSNKFFQVKDLGDLTMSRQSLDDSTLEEKDYIYLSHYAKRLSDVILEQLKNDQFVLTIGGDHSVATGTLSAVIGYNPNVKIIWIDAHADINTPKTSPSGNLHGMPVALGMGLVEQKEIAESFKWMPRLDPKNIAYIGLRDVDAGEQKFLDDLGIINYSARDVKKLGIHRVLSEIKFVIDPEDNSEFHLSFDVDGIDPVFFPSTGTPVSEGLDLVEGQSIIDFFARTKRLLALDLVEINPMLGNAEQINQTLNSAKCLLNAIPNWIEIQSIPMDPNIWPNRENFSNHLH